MEEKRPAIVRQSASFNPEAATFSPTTSNPESPWKLAKVTDSVLAWNNLNIDQSSFRPALELRPIYEACDESSTSQLPGAQPNPSYMPLDLHDLVRALKQVQHEAAQKVLPLQSIDTPVPYLPPGLFCPQSHESNFSAPEVDELSKTLGLPGVTTKKKANEEGPLMEQALEKPLTANTLAHYMSSPSKATGAAHSSRPSREFSVQLDQMNEEDLPTRMVQPPPGFYGENPRFIHADDSNTTIDPDPQPIPTGSAAFSKTSRFSDLQFPGLPQHHPQYRISGNKRQTRPRAATRTKRSDQGPEPSLADIYPDDAVYIPSSSSISSRRPSFAVPDQHLTALQGYIFDPPPYHCAQRAIIEDPSSWPTPAEVYATKSTTTIAVTTATATAQQPSASTQTPATLPAPSTMTTAAAPVFDLFADHYTPSIADIYEADGHVDALMDLTPYLFALEFPDPTLRDERPLTPGQQDGSRYGLRFYGIGLGDCWHGAPLTDEGDVRL